MVNQSSAVPLQDGWCGLLVGEENCVRHLTRSEDESGCATECQAVVQGWEHSRGAGRQAKRGGRTGKERWEDG